MAKWIFKATTQKALSLLPQGHRVNGIFQRYVSKSRLDDAKMDLALVHCADHMRHVSAHRARDGGLSTLELGTGWYAIVPVGFFLCGVDNVATVDLTRLLRAEGMRVTIRKFEEYYKDGRLAKVLPDLQPERVEKLIALAGKSGDMSLDEMLHALRVRYFVADARRLDLPGGSVDLIHSNNVFEHIYPDVLQEILKEFKRVAKRGGLMSHFIDMTDHFSHSDASIDEYHFLRYSDAEWKIIDNTIAPQSRLRLADYRELYERLEIPISEEKRIPGEPVNENGLVLAPRFRMMAKCEMLVRHAYLISEMSPRPQHDL